MGTDLNGWMEMKRSEGDRWRGVVDISEFVSRNYDMFGCLFGVRNYANFRPIAADRGYPDDVSQETKQSGLFGIGHSESWITWDEIKAIDWNEPGVKPDSRVHRYDKPDDGESVFTMKALSFGQNIMPSGVQLDHETSWEVDGVIYKIETLTRAEALAKDSGWKLVFNIMEFLSQRHNAQVRLVVWFDS